MMERRSSIEKAFDEYDDEFVLLDCLPKQYKSDAVITSLTFNSYHDENTRCRSRPVDREGR
eukprot:scaffold22644_cov44-Cyclotella_meneghiniana.AAC.1